MAAVAVTAELTFRDGNKEKISVGVQNQLGDLVRGVHELSGTVSELLTQLVEKERSTGAAAEVEEEEDDDEDEESENCELQPAAKKLKT